MSKIVIALGGNALQRNGEEATNENQIRNLMLMADSIANIVKKDMQVIITHGNGPQVGRIMLQNEAAKDITPPMPMDVCGAMTQGMIGYQIQQCLKNVLAEQGIQKEVCTIITQMIVDPNDAAFKNPSKPVGCFYTKEEAEKLSKEKGYAIKQDSNRGYRRVVPSPKPIRVEEIDTIKRLYNEGVIVITVGGGGIPVLRDAVYLQGVEAVIDKDYASAVIAEQIDADILMILTEVSNIAINFGKPNEKKLRYVTVDELEKYKAEGHFAPGSMLPKVEAAAKFVKSGTNKKAIITSLSNAMNALDGNNATIITLTKQGGDLYES